MKNIHTTASGFYAEAPDGTIIVGTCAGSDEEKVRMAEEQLSSYTPARADPEPTQSDRIEETVTSTALTVEYLSCLQEISAEDE